MVLTPLEVEQAAMKMAMGCMGKKWDELKSEKDRENFRTAVKNMAAVYDSKKTDQTMQQFMNWVSLDVTKMRSDGV